VSKDYRAENSDLETTWKEAAWLHLRFYPSICQENLKGGGGD